MGERLESAHSVAVCLQTLALTTATRIQDLQQVARARRAGVPLQSILDNKLYGQAESLER